MPDLGNISLALTCCPSNIKPLSPSLPDVQLDSAPFCFSAAAPVKTLVEEGGNWDRKLQIHYEDTCNSKSIRDFRRDQHHHRGGGAKKGPNGKSLDDYVNAWVQKNKDSDAPPSRYALPFLDGAKKSVECLLCHRTVYPGERILCSVRSCEGFYHSACVKKRLNVSNTRKFKCPQHACFICNQKYDWRCVRCPVAAHDKCGAWPDKVIRFNNQPRRAICWRHPTDWRLDKEAG